MSGSSRRRQSKWDHRDSETLSENFLDKDPPRKARESHSPSRSSHRHDNRSRERVTSWDREGNCNKMSPGLDEWRHRDRSRSPRNGWGRSYRSRSRSRSPDYNSRREPGLTEKGRSKSGVSAQICRDFANGRCRRGNHCQFLHQDAQSYDGRRPLGSSPRSDWEGRDRRTGSSRYSPDDTKNNIEKSERRMNLCNDFVKGRCRRGASCKYAHHDATVDVFERGPAADGYRSRDNDRRNRDTYPDRNHDHENSKRGETLCKFFAAGNCRNGNRCRFSHQVQENFSPERRSQDDRPGLARKFDATSTWEGPKWDDSKASNTPAEQGWGEDKNEITEVTREVTTVRSEDDPWSHGMVKMKQTWDVPSSTHEPKSGEEMPSLQTENIAPRMGLSASIGTEIFSGDMEISPRDVLKPESVCTTNSRTPHLSNISFPAVQQATAGEAPYEQLFQSGFQEHKAFNDPYSGRNPSFKEDKSDISPAEGGNVVGNSNNSYITTNSPINVQPGQSVFQGDQRINVQSMPSVNLPHGQGQLPFPLHPSAGVMMQFSTPNPPMNVPPGQGILQNDLCVHIQPASRINPSAGQSQLPLPLHASGGNGIQTSHNPPSFLDIKTVDGPYLANVNTSAPVSATATNCNSVSSEQLAQLSHLSASLAQLLESRQQVPQLSSAVTPSGASNLSNSATVIPPDSAATFQSNHTPETLKQYDPIGDSIELKVSNIGNHALPSLGEHKTSDIELCHDVGNVNQQEPVAESRGDENGGKIAEAETKAPENRPSDNRAEDDGADDGKKSKDAKGLRTFKFALADFVKELLKPSWKDGQVSKEAYKTIVKKVVDKVIETQGLQIPQTKEKIDQYLLCSKPKLEKLVQAYVGKYQKN